ncbi:MAG: hypothetical protein AAFV47_10730 [Pseudomonadota bacterium]
MTTTPRIDKPLHRSFVVLTLLTLAVLLVPLVAMQYTTEVNWQLGDFVAFGVLFFAAGSCGLFVLRRFAGRQKIVLFALAMSAFVLLWAELAVGVFTSLGS